MGGRAADAVDRQQPAAFLDDRRERRELVPNPGARLVVREKHRADAGVALERIRQSRGIDLVSPLGIETDDVDAVGERDPRPQLPEPSHCAEQRLIVGIEQVRDRSFERPGPARRHQQNVDVRAEPLLEARYALGEQLRELRPPWIDHRAPDRLAYRVRQGAGTWHEEISTHVARERGTGAGDTPGPSGVAPPRAVRDAGTRSGNHAARCLYVRSSEP